MAIPAGQSERIFLHEVKQGVLGGTASTSSLRQGFRRMKEKMEAHGASDEDLSDLRRRIEKAIDDYRWRGAQQDQQETARDALLSAFDGMIRDEKAQVVNSRFLSGVAFE